MLIYLVNSLTICAISSLVYIFLFIIIIILVFLFVYCLLIILLPYIMVNKRLSMSINVICQRFSSTKSLMEVFIAVFNTFYCFKTCFNICLVSFECFYNMFTCLVENK